MLPVVLFIGIAATDIAPITPKVPVPNGLAGTPRGATPKVIVARLNQAFVAARNARETKTSFATLLAEPVPTTPEEFGASMSNERSKYEGLVKASGARVD